MDCIKKASAENMEIVYPIKNEELGVKRFFVKDPEWSDRKYYVPSIASNLFKPLGLNNNYCQHRI
jgi:hypothetical protein